MVNEVSSGFYLAEITRHSTLPGGKVKNLKEQDGSEKFMKTKGKKAAFGTVRYGLVKTKEIYVLPG